MSHQFFEYTLVTSSCVLAHLRQAFLRPSAYAAAQQEDQADWVHPGSKVRGEPQSSAAPQYKVSLVYVEGLAKICCPRRDDTLRSYEGHHLRVL